MTLVMHSTPVSTSRQNKTYVRVETSEYGPQTGTLEFICPSPFQGETVLRAFVVSLPGKPFWTEYPIASNLHYIENPDSAPEIPERELEDDPEYLQFLYDCERTELALELAD